MGVLSLAMYLLALLLIKEIMQYPYLILNPTLSHCEQGDQELQNENTRIPYSARFSGGAG